MGDLVVVGQLGDWGGGGGLVMVVNLSFFSDVAAPFFVEEMPTRGQK